VLQSSYDLDTISAQQLVVGTQLIALEGKLVTKLRGSRTRTLLPYFLRSALAPTTANLVAPVKKCCADNAAACAEDMLLSSKAAQRDD